MITMAQRLTRVKTKVAASRTLPTAVAAGSGRRSSKAAATFDPKTYTISPLSAIEVDTRTTRIAALNAEEARGLTEQIQQTSARLWLLVTEAHDRKAHLALGYETWADYVKAELNISESRSYQYLDTGHVMKALASAGVDVERTTPPPTRVIARVKDRLTDVRRVAVAATKKGEDIDEAVRALAREPRPRAAGAPRGPSAAEGKTAAAAASAATATTSAKVVDTVQCPACKGTGQVSRSLADLVRDLMNKVRAG